MDYTGVIIEESLEQKDVLDFVKIISKRVEVVTEKHKTPWLKIWTLLTVEVFEGEAEGVAQKISEALEPEHPWYADFKNESTHFIIFKNKVFKIDKTKAEQYNEAREYGISLGIPEYQVNFHP